MTFNPQQNQNSVNPQLSSPARQISIPRSGVNRPAWLNRSNKQLAILVRDCSGSMSGSKAADATAASQGLVSELAQPSNYDGFEVAVINFESSAKMEHDVTLASELAGRVSPVYGDGGTDVATGLRLASEILARPKFQSETYLRPVIVAFSDGCTGNRASAESFATSLKVNAVVVSVVFGSDADEAFLRGIATSPEHFYRCSDGKSLRALFAAIGATLSVTLQRGQNATQALSQIRFQQ